MCIAAIPFAKEHYWAQAATANIESSNPEALKGNGHFDEQFYGHLLDKVISEEINVDMVVLKIKSAIYNRH